LDKLKALGTPVVVVTVAIPDAAPMLAVIFACPGEFAVTTPEESTRAIALEEDQIAIGAGSILVPFAS
jgi:hypothetical protein